MRFIKGYTKELEMQVKRGGFYNARCESCSYYDLDEKACANGSVTPFDITVTKDRTFCPFWKPVVALD